MLIIFCHGYFCYIVADYGIHQNSYSYNGCAGTLRCNGNDRMYSYGPHFEVDDKVEMIFDAGKGYLSFIINGRSIKKKSVYNSTNIEGIAFSNIKKSNDLKYRMGISINSAGDGCQLIAFKQTDS